MNWGFVGFLMLISRKVRKEKNMLREFCNNETFWYKTNY